MTLPTNTFNRIALLLFMLLLAACDHAESPITTRFLAFGTLVDLTVSGVSQEEADRATAAIEQDFAEMNHA